MQLKNIRHTLANFSLGGPVIATEVKPAYAYKEGQRLDKVQGIKVSVVFPGNHYDTLTVTVADPVDRLSAVLDKGETVHVDFQGFTARVYAMDGRAGVSAKADSVRIIKDKEDILEIE